MGLMVVDSLDIDLRSFPRAAWECIEGALRPVSGRMPAWYLVFHP
jgi:hypothetical protein